jgi:hypothetical protein
MADEEARRRQASEPDKGKPFERMGRKATGLSPSCIQDMVAGSPGEHSVLPSSYVSQPCLKKV